jgi:2-dehydropantoate 2-reductase
LLLVARRLPMEIDRAFRIAVVGTGAIGTYYGGKLAAAGRAVHFLIRGPLDEVRCDGLRIVGPDDNIHVHPVACSNSTNEIGPCDLVLIAIKGTANAVLPDLLRPLLHDQTILMTLQNGLGSEELLARHFGAERVLAGLCFICLSRSSRTTVEQFDRGHIAIGEFQRDPQPRTFAIARAFQECGINSRIAHDLALERWRKLVWNIPFNGLSILAGGVDTATILQDTPLQATTLALMGEVIAAANRCGHPLEEAVAAEQIERTKTMGAYRPSTLLDFEAGRPLEIEAIWGEPLRRARSAGTDTPRLQMMYSLLRSLDQVRQKEGCKS